jgi:transposase
MTLRHHLVQCARKEGIRAAARQYSCSRNTVRKWLRRSQDHSFEELSRVPRRSPAKTAADLEQAVVAARKQTGYGPHRLKDWLMSSSGAQLSVWTIRNIVRRNGLFKHGTRRNACYPAHWAWEAQEPFSLVQCDVKDVYDKGTLGTKRTTHLARVNLPRYQWTFLEGKSRLRFLAYSRALNQDCALAFLLICLWWLGRFKVRPKEELQIQTDWGTEFGGDNPAKVELLNRKYLAPLGARLCRYPKGRKGYNGRIERLHRSDDEEFYMPMLLDIGGPLDYLDRAFKWQAFYNLRRPHYGKGMDGSTPMQKLAALGLNLKESFALLPPVILDPIAGPIVTPPVGGHDVQAHYTMPWASCRSPEGPRLLNGRGADGSQS